MSDSFRLCRCPALRAGSDADWPICLQAITIPDWVALRDLALEDVVEADRRADYFDCESMRAAWGA